MFATLKMIKTSKEDIMPSVNATNASQRNLENNRFRHENTFKRKFEKTCFEN